MNCNGFRRGVVLFLGLAAAASVCAQDEDCQKNHYILDTPVCDTRATEVPIGAPGAVAVNMRGDVYFSVPNLVFRVDAGGGITHVAGSITAGFAGDGGPATAALLNFPTWYPERVEDPYDFDELLGALALDTEGNLYITDAYNNRVRKVDANGIITTIAGDGEGRWGWTGDGVQVASSHFWWPQGVAVDAAGNLLIADSNGELNRVLPDGRMFHMALNDCAHFLAPGLCAPVGIAVDSAGGVYVADGYCRIRKFGGPGNDGTVAGDERPNGVGSGYTCGYSGDGGPATSAALSRPFGVAVDALGNLFIADAGDNCIRKVDTAGIITTHAGTCSLRSLAGTLTLDESGFSGDDGPATAAQLRAPHGVAVDAAGNVYIADTGNLRIRKVSPDGIITTFAGNGHALPLQ